MQVTNWIIKWILINLFFNKEKPTKGNKDQRKERFDIVGVATRVKHDVLYVISTSIPNVKSDVKIDNKFELHMTMQLKII